MADEALAVFMDVTGCGYDDAFHRLASCGGHLGEAVNRFFNADAGTSSGTRRPSPPPSPQLIISSSDDDSDPDYDDAAARAPIQSSRRRRALGGGAARGRSPPPGSSGSPKKVSRWDSETPRGRPGNNNKKKKRHRRRLDMFASSSGEEEEEEKVEAAKKSRRQRRRLNPMDSSDEEEKVQAVTTRSTTRGAGAGEKKRPEDGNTTTSLRRRYPERVLTFGSDDDMELAEAAPPSRPPPRRPAAAASKAAERDALFRAPRGLAYKCGSLHGAKAHAAARRRWLLVNVVAVDMASLAQNRDVWGSDLVAQCVREHFVLWQADAGDVDGGGGEVGEEEVEARKVLCYYKVPLDRLPVVVVVDPVTGEAVDRLHGSDPNDFLVSVGPYTDKKPEFPVLLAGTKKNNHQRPPPPAITAPTSRLEPAPAARKPAEHAVAAASSTGRTREEEAPAATKPAEQTGNAAAAAIGEQPAAGEKVCKMRVRMPDGRVVAQEFGSQRAVAALFAYCRSELGGAGKPLRLLHFVGAAREAIADEDASFESLGLHMSTVCVQLG
ncbi:unnamed protein product [Urochloa humidicola]